MCANEASSDVVGLFSMPHSSHITNFDASTFVRTYRNDTTFLPCHHSRMARRGIPKRGTNWFIREWMDYFGHRQTDMQRMCGWSKATASQIYNGLQDYSPKLVNEASVALHLEPFELLMTPDQAMAYRRLREDAFRIIERQPIKATGTDG